VDDVKKETKRIGLEDHILHVIWYRARRLAARSGNAPCNFICVESNKISIFR